MGLPLIVLLALAAPTAEAAPHAARARAMTHAESFSAVDVSAAQRFGWVDAARPRPTPAVAPVLPRSGAGGAPFLSPTLRPDGELGAWSRGAAVGVVHAAQWVDALPVKVDVQDGGMMLTLRLRGP